MYDDTMLGTQICPNRLLLNDDFPVCVWWDMLVPWGVHNVDDNYIIMHYRALYNKIALFDMTTQCVMLCDSKWWHMIRYHLSWCMNVWQSILHAMHNMRYYIYIYMLIIADTCLCTPLCRYEYTNRTRRKSGRTDTLCSVLSIYLQEPRSILERWFCL